MTSWFLYERRYFLTNFLKLIVEYVTHYFVLGINLNSKLVLFLYRGLISRWAWSFSELLVVVCLGFENPQSRPITDNRNISSKKIMCEIWS